MVQRRNKRWDSRNVERRGVFFLGLVVCLLLSFPYFEELRNANEMPRILQALAWLNDGVLHLDTPATRGFSPGPDVARGVGGHLFPNKPPGGTAVAVAGVVAARVTEAALGIDATLRSATWWTRLFGGVLPLLLLAASVVRTDGGGARRFWAAAGALTLLCFATPIFSYGRLAYGNMWSALLLYAGVTNLVGHGDKERIPAPAWGGMLAGAAVLFEYVAVFAALPIAVMLLARVGRDGGLRELLWAVVGALIPVGALMAYHDHAFGSPWSTGYHNAANAVFSAKHQEGVLGLVGPSWRGFSTQILDPGAGLLWWAPGALLGMFGLGWMGLRGTDELTRRRGTTMLAVMLVVIMIVVSLNFEGGWRVGPRYLVVVLPCMLPGICFGLEHERRGVFLAAWGIALGVGALPNVLAATMWPHFDLTHVGNPVGEVLLPLLREGVEPYGPLTMAGVTRGTTWVALLGAAGMLFMVAGSVGGSRREDRGIIGVLTLVVGFCISAWIWTTPEHGDQPAANLSYIRAHYEPRVGAPESRKLPVLTNKRLERFNTKSGSRSRLGGKKR